MQIYEGKVKCIDDNRVNRSKICCNLCINNFVLRFEIDTGAPVTIVSLTDVVRSC